MDIPNSSSTPTSSNSSSWDLDMTMGNHLLLDQLQHQNTPYEFLNPNTLDNNSQFQAMNQREMVLYEGNCINTSNSNQHSSNNNINVDMGLEDEEEGQLGAMKEMMYKIAAMQPVDIDPSTIKKPKRRNVRISDDPQSIAARHRRERISERIRILQRLVPGGTKMDTASMLDEAIRYVKFLKRQVQELQANPPPQSQAMVQVGSLNWPSTSHGSGDPGSSSSAMGGHNGLGFGFLPSNIRPN